jgi:ABC-type branched-subunit amino acid transport system ATPase component
MDDAQSSIAQDSRQARRLVSPSARASSTTCKPATVAREGKTLFSRSYRRRVSSYLSGGEQQMVAIGRMLISDLKVTLLDEPSVALSPVAVGIMVDALLKLRQRGASLLLVEQRIDVAVRVCDRLYVMTHGAIVDE